RPEPRGRGRGLHLRLHCRRRLSRMDGRPGASGSGRARQIDEGKGGMKFADRERKRAVEQREAFFRDPGHGRFASKRRDFVISEAALNLWAGIREDALGYFEANRISWWKGHRIGRRATSSPRRSPA